MRRITSFVACAALVGLATGSITTAADAKTTPPTAAAPSIKTSPYVALGDSYSSAAGVAPQVLTAPPACSRSQLNYAHDNVMRTHPAAFTDVTCSGAKTSDFFTSQTAGVAPQLDAVHKTTRLVTMTISGNDENVFVSSFFGCPKVDAGHPYGNPCQMKYGHTFTDLLKTQTYPHLVKALSAVRAKAPHATIVILGYPQILPAEGSLSCYALMGLSEGDVKWLVNQAKVGNDVVRRAAAVTGARYVDTYTPSAGHDACSGVGTRWMEPLVGPVNAYPIHPNAVGEAAMARETLAAIGRQEPGRRQY